MQREIPKRMVLSNHNIPTYTESLKSNSNKEDFCPLPYRQPQEIDSRVKMEIERLLLENRRLKTQILQNEITLRSLGYNT